MSRTTTRKFKEFDSCFLYLQRTLFSGLGSTLPCLADALCFLAAREYERWMLCFFIYFYIYIYMLFVFAIIFFRSNTSLFLQNCMIFDLATTNIVMHVLKEYGIYT